MRNMVCRIAAGFVIGIAAAAPGVSGGVIAVGLGLYEPIIHSLRNIRRDLGGTVKLIAPLAVGAIPGIVLACGVLGELMRLYLHPMIYLFAGLIAGGLPTVYREAVRDGYRALHLTALLGGLLLLGAFSTLSVPAQPAIALTPFTAAVSGCIEAVGTAIPGISASFMLLYLGLYQAQLATISTLDAPCLTIMALTFAITMALLVRLVSLAFEKARACTYWAIIGFTVGSILMVLPPITQVESPGTCGLVLVVGALSGWLSGRAVNGAPACAV